MPGSLLTISPCLCSLSQYEIVITTYSILAKEIPIQKEETDVAEDCLVQVTEMCKNDFKIETRNYSVEMKTIFKDRFVNLDMESFVLEWLQIHLLQFNGLSL